MLVCHLWSRMLTPHEHLSSLLVYSGVCVARSSDFDYPFRIFKLFLISNEGITSNPKQWNNHLLNIWNMKHKKKKLMYFYTMTTLVHFLLGSNYKWLVDSYKCQWQTFIFSFSTSLETLSTTSIKVPTIFWKSPISEKK